MTASVRVRFAPSPTGALHVGGLRTALFNWVFARQQGGTFILRLEDTDRERYVPGSEDAIFQALDWLDLTPDEGPRQGGPHAPYIQSERLVTYQAAARELVARGSAYECFCTRDRLDALRAEQSRRKEAPRYDRLCRDLTAADRADKHAANHPCVIRLAVLEAGTIEADDLIRGHLTFSLATLDDTVLLKSDGFPTYHLANVVDDHAMGITHIIRAEEWLPSLPKHLFLYQAFGWTPPLFAHLSLLLGTDRSKLSKRHGDVSVQEFIAKGYLPEAMFNYLALLGWNPGDDRELFSREELIKLFSLERVQPSGAVFDRTKLDWMNLQYLKALPDETFAQRCIAALAHQYPQVNTRPPTWRMALVSALRDRIHRFDEAVTSLHFVFHTPSYDTSLLVPKKGSATAAKHGLVAAHNALVAIADQDWTVDRVRSSLQSAVTEVGESAAVLWPTRIAVTGLRASPPVYESVALLTKAEVLNRLQTAIAQLA